MRAPLVALPLLLLACTSDRLDVASVPSCEDTPRDVALDEATPLGTTAADVLATLPASETTTFTWADGGTTGLVVAFTPGSTARFVDSEVVTPESGEVLDIGVICDDRLEVDGDLAFATDDGAFDEVLRVTLQVTAEAVTIFEALDLDGLDGTFDLEPLVTEEGWDTLAAFVDVRFLDGASSGRVEGSASGEDDCSDDADTCTAWDMAVPVGTWGDADLPE